MEQMRRYIAKSGKQQYKPSTAYLMTLSADGEGFCLACGNTQSAEPDACRYKCETCGEHKVYGAEELALMGLCY